MALATIPGYPRIGRQRELKRAVEAYWAGKRSADQLRQAAAELRRANWQTQQAAGLDLIPVNDFSLYDQMLDATVLAGAVPERYGPVGEQVDLDTYFAMARGRTGADDVRAMEMTKWFDTNYHYIVPELGPDATFRLASDKPFRELAEAQASGISAKPVLIGPYTFLRLAKSHIEEFAPLQLLDKLLPVYQEVIGRLAAAGAAWIQLDEPALVLDPTPEELAAVRHAYEVLSQAKGDAKLLVQTYFDHVGGAYETLVGLPVEAIGLDFVRNEGNLELLEQHGFPKDKWLAAGVIDGRNIWAADLRAALSLLERIVRYVDKSRLMVSSSCSLLHVPYDVRLEDELDPEIRSWLAFAEQKLDELVVLTRALNEGEAAVAEQLAANKELIERRAASPRRTNPAVRARIAALPPVARPAPFAQRATVQAERLGLPALPTTTIGSFPQTGDVRKMRRRFEAGEIDAATYDAYVAEQIQRVIAEQEGIGLDVLVHGEFERNDMVQYFGEQLDGFAFTHHGWVQSYGSRYVRPPIIYGDVQRPHPMTVRWSTYAQSLTERPVKGMLTGPVTILNWSFVRNDQPRAATCREIALAIRDEVTDLENAGIAIIQIDEPALREGLPLHHADWEAYLAWAVECFRLASAGAKPETQIHTHMCYSEFGDIIDAISALDADVISIENARSDLELLGVFRNHGYDKSVGPGVYDIHSPRVPPTSEIAANLRATLTVLDPAQVWVNPDCGLKTRQPAEVQAALTNMVEAAKDVRGDLS